MQHTTPLSTPHQASPSRVRQAANPGTFPEKEQDIVLFSAADLTASGNVPVILSDIPAAARDKIEKALKEQFKGRVTSDLPLVNGFTVEINPKVLQKFVKLLPPEANVRIDSKLQIPDPLALMPSPEMKGPKEDEASAKNVQLEALGIKKLWDKGYTGKGVGVCVIDSGIKSHEDFGDRLIDFKDMSSDGKTDNYDPFGHGTHVSGIIGGNGAASAGKIMGAAPDCNLIGVRITCVSEAIKALQWAIENKQKDGIDIINMSLGDYAVKSYKDDPWCQAAEKAVDAGIMVFVAAGNEGPGEKSISTPAIDPRLITVGAYDDRKTVATDDDRIYENSSRGPTPVDNLPKPDILGYGVKIYSTLAEGSTLDVSDMGHIGNKYIEMTGSSMAAPELVGIAACLKSADRSLTHDRAKAILTSTARKVSNLDGNSQGAGVVDPPAALAALEKEMAQAKDAGKGTAIPTTMAAVSPQGLMQADGWNIA